MKTPFAIGSLVLAWPVLGFIPGAMIFWVVLIIGLFILLGLMRRAPGESTAMPALDAGLFNDPVLESAAREVMAITGKRARQGTLQFEGRLLLPAPEAYARLSAAVGSDRKVILQDAGAEETRILVLPVGALDATQAVPARPWLHLGLFLLTLVTTTWAGAVYQGANLWVQPGAFVVGLPYSLSLLLILGSHELGHYFAARRHRMNVSLPYFIPVPFALGTFGAFIRMRALAPDRKSLFDMAVAGPLAGLVFAVPLLLIGLHFSQVVPGASQVPFGSLDVGSSLLVMLLAKLAVGNALVSGHTLLLHPLAFAGWLGLLVTALNLLPIGQLDGGHIAHAVFGPAGAHKLSVLASGALLLLALFVWPGLLLFALLVLLFAGTHDAPSADDVTALSPGRKWLGYVTLGILLLILLPVPHHLSPHLGIQWPYR